MWRRQRLSLRSLPLRHPNRQRVPAPSSSLKALRSLDRHAIIDESERRRACRFPRAIDRPMSGEVLHRFAGGALEGTDYTLVDGAIHTRNSGGDPPNALWASLPRVARSSTASKYTPR